MSKVKTEVMAKVQDTDPNAQFRIFDITLPSGEEEKTRRRIYLLNPGETFQSFGGSRHGLTVRGGASLIISTNQGGSRCDMEYSLRGGESHPDVWEYIQRWVLSEAGVKVEYPK